ncbi:MAG: hypothetical protein ACK4S0_14595, partial [Sediminibacterium sp.]
LFVWVFGLTRGWNEINQGSDIRLPGFYKPIMKFITPTLLIFVFVGSLITPAGNDWISAFQNGWELDNSSIIKTIANSGLKEQISASSDPAEITKLENQLMLTNYSRLLLLLLFSGISYLVYIDYQKRIKQRRA